VANVLLIQDSREQLGYGSSGLFTQPWQTDTLPLGDYSVCALENLVAIERKSFSDFLNSLTNSRERFERELKQSRHLHKFFLVVECTWADLLVDSFAPVSQAHPAAIRGTIFSWQTRFCPILFGGTREQSASLVQGILLNYAKEFLRQAEKMTRAIKLHHKSQEHVHNERINSLSY
jgi:ERCC4-type nuclease